MSPAPPVRLCPRHRVAIGTTGCPQCIRQEKLAARQEQQAFWRWLVRASIPLLILGLWLALKPHKPESDHLDPEPFRNAIETAESVFYRGDRLTLEDRSALTDALQALREQLHRSVPSVALRRAIEGMEMFLEATALEAYTDRLDVVAAREQWEVLRQAHFQEAAWFQHGSAALEEAQTSSSARGVPPDADRYEACLEQIRALANRLEAAIELLPGNPDDLDKDSYDRWQSLKVATATDVERIIQGFPLKRLDVDERWQQALRKLEKALETVSRIAGPDIHSPSLVPGQNTGRVRVSLANAAIQAARESIAAAPH